MRRVLWRPPAAAADMAEQGLAGDRVDRGQICISILNRGNARDSSELRPCFIYISILVYDFVYVVSCPTI